MRTSWTGGSGETTTGAIAGAAFVLGRRAIFDLPTAVIGLATLGIVWRWKVPEPFLIAAVKVIGLLALRF